MVNARRNRSPLSVLIFLSAVHLQSGEVLVGGSVTVLSSLALGEVVARRLILFW